MLMLLIKFWLLLITDIQHSLSQTTLDIWCIWVSYFKYWIERFQHHLVEKEKKTSSKFDLTHSVCAFF